MIALGEEADADSGGDDWRVTSEAGPSSVLAYGSESGIAWGLRTVEPSLSGRAMDDARLLLCVRCKCHPRGPPSLRQSSTGTDTEASSGVASFRQLIGFVRKSVIGLKRQSRQRSITMLAPGTTAVNGVRFIGATLGADCKLDGLSTTPESKVGRRYATSRQARCRACAGGEIRRARCSGRRRNVQSLKASLLRLVRCDEPAWRLSGASLTDSEAGRSTSVGVARLRCPIVRGPLRGQSLRVDCAQSCGARRLASMLDTPDSGQSSYEPQVASEQRRVLRLHRHRGRWARLWIELDAEGWRGRLHVGRRTRTEVLGESRAAPRGRTRTREPCAGGHRSRRPGKRAASGPRSRSKLRGDSMHGCSSSQGRWACPSWWRFRPPTVPCGLSGICSDSCRRRCVPAACGRHQGVDHGRGGRGLLAAAKSGLPKHWRPCAKHTHVDGRGRGRAGWAVHAHRSRRSARDVATSPHRGGGRRRGDAVPLRARAATGGRRRRQEADDEARTVVHPLLSQEVETGAAGSPAELARLRVSEGARTRARTSTAARGRESARRALGGASCRDSESPVDWADVRSSVLSRICGIATTGRPMQGAAGWRWRRLPGVDAHLSDVRHEGG